MTTKKLGDGFIAAMILLFLVTLFSYVLISMEISTGIDTGEVSSSLTSLNNNLSNVKSTQVSLLESSDEESAYSIEDPEQSLETRGANSAGLWNIATKNIFSKFFIEFTESIPGSSIVLGFLGGLISIIVGILFFRFWLGDNKI